MDAETRRGQSATMRHGGHDLHELYSCRLGVLCSGQSLPYSTHTRIPTRCAVGHTLTVQPISGWDNWNTPEYVDGLR